MTCDCDKKETYFLNFRLNVVAVNRMKFIVSLGMPLLVRIFSHLSARDKKAVASSCVFLWRVMSEPLLWAEVTLSRRRLEEGLEAVTELFYTPRYSLLACLNLSNLKYLFIDKTRIADFLKYLLQNTNLRSVNLSNNDLSAIPAFPLASNLARVTSLEMSNTKLGTEQLNSLLGKCCRGRYTKNVNLSFNDFSYVNPDLLAESIVSLERVNLSYTDLTPMYTRRLLESLKKASVKELDLSGNDLTSCKLDNIGLNQNLSILKLSEVKFNPEKLDDIFTNMTFIHNLRELCLNGSTLYDVNPIILSDAVVRVERVDLNFCWLYADHIEFILDGITEDTMLRYLNLSGNHFEDVNIDLLLLAITNLEQIKIECANLSEEHFEALVNDTEELPKRTKIVLNHFELITKNIELHRLAKLHPNIELNLQNFDL